MNNYGFGTVYFFVGMFLMMLMDIALQNIGFLISMNILMILGSYCGFRWVIEKRKMEVFYRLNPIKA